MDDTVHSSNTRPLEDTLLASETMDLPNGERAFLLLQIHSDAATGKTLKKECIALLDHALATSEGDLSERMDSALKELNGLVKGMLLSKALHDMHAIVAVVGSDKMMHVSHAGQAEAYVVRGGNASQVTEYTKGKPSPSFVHIASGQLEPADVVILSTQRLLRAFTPAQLAQLAQKEDSLMGDLKRTLESESEQAALATFHVAGQGDAVLPSPLKTKSTRKKRTGSLPALNDLSGSISGLASKGKQMLQLPKGTSPLTSVRTFVENLWKDLLDPKRQRRAHFFLIAFVLAIFLVIWAWAGVATLQQTSQTRAELEQIVEQVNEDLRTAENRRMTGDIDSSNAILDRAEQRAKEILASESDAFRREALDQLDRVRQKREEINNVTRLSPTDVVSMASKKPSVDAVGMIGLGDEEFIVFDKQDLYRVIYNNIDDPDRLSDEELILAGANFPRYQTYVFQTTGNGMIEIISGQSTSMKTEDPAGWIAGQDIETYLRFLYVLSPENNQIYKYERLSNRYAAPDPYNVNGELAGALDMAIDGSIFILKEGGDIVKLLRGEVQPFEIRYLPDGVMDTATKIYKAPESNMYVLDPDNNRVVIVTDGGASGESSYVKQFILEDDKVEELKDLWVDEDESNLYVLDKKRLYKIALRK